ncbi:MAG: HAD hydrolase family protein [Thermodesulfobacteriota bacterium]
MAEGYPGDCELTRALQKRAMERTGESARGYAWKNSLERAAAVELVLFDVDGVLTDGSLIYHDDGLEIKTFNSRDGFGISLLHRAGIQTGIITARTSGAVERRARNLGIAHLHQGQRNKLDAYRQILAQTGLADAAVAYVGDDWLDLPLLSRVGFAVAVADAAPEVRAVAHYTTRAAGGRGAVREVCELIIDARGMYETLLARYLEGKRDDL